MPPTDQTTPTAVSDTAAQAQTVPTATAQPAMTSETPAPVSRTGTPPPDTVAQIADQPHSDNPNLKEVYATICSQIIKEQGQVIGTLSYEQANLVEGLQVDPWTFSCVITGEPLVVLEKLVDKYRQFFGNAAVEVCREAALHLKAQLPDEQIPELLRG